MPNELFRRIYRKTLQYDQQTNKAYILIFEPTDDLLRLKDVKHYLVNTFFFKGNGEKKQKKFLDKQNFIFYKKD
jgi:hypothetical protein